MSAARNLSLDRASLEAVLERSPLVAVVHAGPDGRIEHCNAHAARLLGAEPSALLGRALTEFSPALDPRIALSRTTGDPSGPPLEIEIRDARGLARWVLSSLHRLGASEDPGASSTLVWLAVEITARTSTERSLRQLAEGVSSATGERFFRSLVEHLARALGLEFAMVGEIAPGGGAVDVVAIWSSDAVQASFSYALAGTPCENVLRGGLCLYPSGVQQSFPNDLLLAQMGVESYLGTPLRDSAGTALGLLVVMGKRALIEPGVAASTLQIFAARAAAELERKRSEDQLRASQARLERQNRTLLELAGSKAFESGDLRDALREITVAAARSLEVARSGVWFLSDDRALLECMDLYLRDQDAHVAGVELRAADFPIYFQALQDYRCIDATDASTDPRTAEFAEIYFQPQRIGATLDSPVRLGGRVVGVACHEHGGGLRTWTSEEQHFSASIADLIAVSIEAWERRRAQEALRLRNRELSALHRISEIGLGADDMDDALAQIAREIASATSFPVVWIELCGAGGALELHAAEGIARDALARFSKAGALPSLEVARTGELEVVATTAEKGSAGLRELGLPISVVVPMTIEQRVLGVLGLARADAAPIEEHVVPLATRLAAATATLVERVRSRAHERALQEQLRHAQKLEAVGTLAGGVAHDFNNLLTAILGYTYLLKQNSSHGDAVQRAADVIENAAERAAELTQQLLGFARQGKHENLPVDLHAIVRDVAQLFRRTIDENIAIVESLRAPTALVLGDPSQMHQLVLNLAVNARDAMPKGGEMRFETACIEPDDVPREAHPTLAAVPTLLMTVHDNGVGIPREILGRIFEPFFTTKEQGKGTGMGLAMVYGILQGHRGAIEVESEEGRGSTFRVYLPLAGEFVEQDTRTTAAPIGGSGTVLVVDDEELVRTSASELLRGLGYTVLAAENGVDAVRLYRQADGDIDLVLLDLVMPRMGGRECLRALKRMDPEVRVLLSSGWQQGGSVQDAMEEGALGLLRKPYQLAALSESVARTIRRPR